MDDLQRVEMLQGALQPMQGGGPMVGGGGGFSPMSGYNDYLMSWMTANPDNPDISNMVMQQLFQNQNPYMQWQMQSEMQNQQWNNMFQMADMAGMMMQSGDPWMMMRGEEMMRNIASGFGGSPQEQGFTDMARTGFGREAQEAAMTGDIEAYRRLSALSELDDAGIELYSQRPTWNERMDQINRYGGVGGYALGGMGTGALAGAGIGSVIPGAGTAVGGVTGGIIGAGLGAGKALLDMFRDEKIKEERLRQSGYGI